MANNLINKLMKIKPPPVKGLSGAVTSFTNIPTLKAEDLGRHKGESVFRRLYYMWLSRLFNLVAIIMLAGNVFFSLTIIQMVPQITVDTLFLVKENESSEISRIEPVNREMSSKDMVMESFIRLYVISRNTIITDMQEMKMLQAPGGVVYYLSMRDIYQNFFKSEDDLKAMVNAGQNREVKILSAQRIGKSAVWRVDFKTYDMSPTGTTITEKKWTASITCFFMDNRKIVSPRMVNPLGFTVVRYSHSEVES